VAEVAPAPRASTADWFACSRCRALVYRRRFRRTLGVCPECQWHFPIPAEQRIEQLFDPGSLRRLPSPEVAADPLSFVDTQPYPRRLAQARERTGLPEAVVCVRAALEGRSLVAAVMDFRFLGGSLGIAVGEAITRAAETALADRVPLLIVTASGGARMQEGALSLMQLAKTSQALAELDEAGILTVALVTDPTYGGVAASYATLTDVILAEPGARLGFAGPRVIEQTIHQRLPEGFQTAEFLLAHGLIDQVVPRAAMRRTLARLLAAGAGARPGTPPRHPDGALVVDPDELGKQDPAAVMRLARHGDRPTTLDYLSYLLDGFVELRGDRISGDCPAIVGGVGQFDGGPVVVLGHQKGHDTRSLLEHNFGMASPAGHHKAARLMRLAAKLHLPLLTFIDTPGASPALEAEEHGQAMTIAANLRLLSQLPVPVIAVIIGEGGSGGALALGVANRVLVLANAFYSVISPEGCAAILWKSPEATPRAAAALKLCAADLLRHRIVDGVVPEPAGGAGADHAAAAARLHDAVAAALAELSRLTGAELVRDRRRRFRRFGTDPAPAHPGRRPRVPERTEGESP
jgi:acetyl-CoA carboxylase carboxyl transferase subunit beta